MIKHPWIQKVELGLCEECYNHLFYGESFLNSEKQKVFYNNYPDPEDPDTFWKYDETFSENTTVNRPSVFTCDMCEQAEKSLKYELTVARIINADKFDEFMESAKECASYIEYQDSEWETLKDMIRVNPKIAEKSILHNTSVVNRTTENFQNFVENEKFINFVKEERNKKYKEE